MDKIVSMNDSIHVRGIVFYKMDCGEGCGSDHWCFHGNYGLFLGKPVLYKESQLDEREHQTNHIGYLRGGDRLLH